MNKKFQIFNDDCLNILKTLPCNSVDSLVTDPPSGTGFAGFKWDSVKGGSSAWISHLESIFLEAHRVLKPGALGLVWALPRTSHWTATALESSGFHVKDVLTHVFGSGFPKSQGITSLIQKSNPVTMNEIYTVTEWIRKRKKEVGLSNKKIDEITETKGGSQHWTKKRGKPQAYLPKRERWEKLKPFLEPIPKDISHIMQKSFKRGQSGSENWRGFGTGLKPASEHWILIQKPISEINLANNILRWGVGVLNIDECRIDSKDSLPDKIKPSSAKESLLWGKPSTFKKKDYSPHRNGRFPANFLYSKSRDQSCPSKILFEQSGNIQVTDYFKSFNSYDPFIYAQKSNAKERGKFNTHPTVKNIGLMRYLCRLVTPPRGTVLDTFMGSGSTGVACLFENFHFIGIEKDKGYFEISAKRLNEFKTPLDLAG